VVSGRRAGPRCLLARGAGDQCWMDRARSVKHRIVLCLLQTQPMKTAQPTLLCRRSCEAGLLPRRRLARQEGRIRVD
jgi:hypothetical protein